MDNQKTDPKELLKPTGIKVLLALDQSTNILSIARKIGVTYPATFSMITTLRNLDLITTRKTGRENIVALTVKGHKVRQAFIEITNLVGIKF